MTDASMITSDSLYVVGRGKFIIDMGCLCTHGNEANFFDVRLNEKQPIYSKVLIFNISFKNDTLPPTPNAINITIKSTSSEKQFLSFPDLPITLETLSISSNKYTFTTEKMDELRALQMTNGNIFFRFQEMDDTGVGNEDAVNRRVVDRQNKITASVQELLESKNTPFALGLIDQFLRRTADSYKQSRKSYAIQYEGETDTLYPNAVAAADADDDGYIAKRRRTYGAGSKRSRKTKKIQISRRKRRLH